MRNIKFEEWVDANAAWLHGCEEPAESFYNAETGIYSHWKYTAIETAWRAWCAALGFMMDPPKGQ